MAGFSKHRKRASAPNAAHSVRDLDLRTLDSLKPRTESRRICRAASQGRELRESRLKRGHRPAAGRDLETQETREPIAKASRRDQATAAGIVSVSRKCLGPAITVAGLTRPLRPVTVHRLPLVTIRPRHGIALRHRNAIARRVTERLRCRATANLDIVSRASTRLDTVHLVIARRQVGSSAEAAPRVVAEVPHTAAEVAVVMAEVVAVTTGSPRSSLSRSGLDFDRRPGRHFLLKITRQAGDCINPRIITRAIVK